jgi:hypothetical protein
MPDDQAIDYAEEPDDLRPTVLDRVFGHLQPLDFLFLSVTPCLLCAPILFVIAGIGVLSCRVPAARRKAWVLLILMAVPAVLVAATFVEPRYLRRLGL